MRRPNLQDIGYFAAVARHLNFRRAAQELAISSSTLSDRIRELEDQVGGRLFNRTTRSTSLTELGQNLLARTQDAVAVIEDAVSGVGPAKAGPVGRVRINGPLPALELRLMPLVTSFLLDHPGIRMEIIAQNELVDVTAGGFDAGVRYSEKLAQDMIAISLGADQRMVVVAAPDLISRHGLPSHPDDLSRMECIGTLFATGNVLPWSFERGSEKVEFSPRANLLVNSIETALIAARAGTGVTYTFEEYVAGDLAAGRLVELLPDWSQPFPGPSLYFAERPLMPPALRAFVDHVKKDRVR